MVADDTGAATHDNATARPSWNEPKSRSRCSCTPWLPTRNAGNTHTVVAAATATIVGPSPRVCASRCVARSSGYALLVGSTPRRSPVPEERLELNDAEWVYLEALQKAARIMVEHYCGGADEPPSPRQLDDTLERWS